jgi:ketosteroid isomerase-like protein
LGSEAAAVVARFYEAFDDGDLAAAVALADDALEMMDPGLGTVQGPGPFRDYLATLKRAVPDAKAVIERTLDADDTVVVEGRFVGTFTGPLAFPDGDVDPNGATVDLRFADVSTVRNGKLVSYHTYYDQLGLLTQLGLMED